MSHERRRVVRCRCGWKGVRLARVNVTPCPACGGEVCVTADEPGRNRGAPRVRVRVWLPERWVRALEPNISPKIKALVGRYLEGDDYDGEELPNADVG